VNPTSTSCGQTRISESAERVFSPLSWMPVAWYNAFPLRSSGCPSRGSMTLYTGYIENSGVLMWGSCWSRLLTIGPTRLRSGLGFADPPGQQMGLMTRPTLGSRELSWTPLPGSMTPQAELWHRFPTGANHCGEPRTELWHRFPTGANHCNEPRTSSPCGRVHDTLRGLYSGLRRVNVGFLLEQAVDHRSHSLALGARIRSSA